MPMNLMHRRLCRSDIWAGKVATFLPAALDGVDLGDDALELGPGFGVTTRLLAPRAGHLTAVEVDEASATRLRAELSPGVDVVHGDGAALPLPGGRFSSVVCFTMLHHVPTRAAQDALFAEARRVLRPGGVFCGTDSQLSWPFRLLHVGDTRNVVDPETLPDRLRAAGFADVDASVEPGVRVRWRARA